MTSPVRGKSDSRGPGRGPSLAALAVDLDRTLVRDGHAPLRPASNVLAAAQRLGLTVVLVSGREYDVLADFVAKLRHVDAFVAENGAVVEAPVGGRPRVVGGAIAKKVHRRLARVPSVNAEFGEVVVSVPRTEAGLVGRLVRDLPVDLVSNVDRTMILPSGITKASGMQLTLRALRLRADRFAAIGDADNDLPLLRDAALSGAVRNAEPQVVAAADYVCRKTFGAGVEEFVRGPVAHYLARARAWGTPE